MKMLFQIVLFVSSFAMSNAEKPTTSEGLESVRAFIAAAPKATTEVDRSYAIKIPEKERREAIERCNAVLAIDKRSVEASRLREELKKGEGRQEAVANVPWNGITRVFSLLDANLIACSGGGTRAFTVNVSQSHAARARRLLAEVIVAEDLKFSLLKQDKGVARGIIISPAEVLKSSR